MDGSGKGVNEGSCENRKGANGMPVPERTSTVVSRKGGKAGQGVKGKGGGGRRGCRQDGSMSTRGRK